MNTEQINIYNSFLRRIDTTIEETVSNIENSLMNKMKDTLENNVSIWKAIQIDIFETSLPGEVKNKLSLICDDGFRKYCKKVDKLSK